MSCFCENVSVSVSVSLRAPIQIRLWVANETAVPAAQPASLFLPTGGPPNSRCLARRPPSPLRAADQGAEDGQGAEEGEEAGEDRPPGQRRGAVTAAGRSLRTPPPPLSPVPSHPSLTLSNPHAKQLAYAQMSHATHNTCRPHSILCGFPFCASTHRVSAQIEVQFSAFKGKLVFPVAIQGSKFLIKHCKPIYGFK